MEDIGVISMDSIIQSNGIILHSLNLIRFYWLDQAVQRLSSSFIYLWSQNRTSPGDRVSKAYSLWLIDYEL